MGVLEGVEGGAEAVDLWVGRIVAALTIGTLLACFATVFFNSWRVDEGSPNAGGLPNWWILKGALVVFRALVAAHGLALTARSRPVLGGGVEFSPRTTNH